MYDVLLCVYVPPYFKFHKDLKNVILFYFSEQKIFFCLKLQEYHPNLLRISQNR